MPIGLTVIVCCLVLLLAVAGMLSAPAISPVVPCLSEQVASQCRRHPADLGVWHL